MRFRKIKPKDGKVCLIFEKKCGGVWDEYQVNCSEAPAGDFHAALRGLIPHVIAMCELPDSYAGRITVKGVSLSYGGENEVMGASISASMKLHDSYQELNLTTPYKASDSYTEGQDADPMQVLTDECVQAVEYLCERAEAYLNGERLQRSLFAAEITPEKAAA